MSTTSWPASRASGGLFSASHFTKNAWSGVAPKSAPSRQTRSRNALIVRLTRPQRRMSFGSKTTHWVPSKIDSST
jgi:hypothetical protein